jgi:hypothetical protein
MPSKNLVELRAHKNHFESPSIPEDLVKLRAHAPLRDARTGEPRKSRHKPLAEGVTMGDTSLVSGRIPYGAAGWGVVEGASWRDMDGLATVCSTESGRLSTWLERTDAHV